MKSEKRAWKQPSNIVEDFCFVPEIRMSQCSKDSLLSVFLLPSLNLLTGEGKKHLAFKTK